MSSAGVLQRAVAGEAVSREERGGLAQWLLRLPEQACVFGLTPAGAERAVAERLSILPAVKRVLEAGPLRVAGYEERAECAPEGLFRFHIPLAQRLLSGAGDASSRFLVAIAGVPAGGKSVFTAIMVRVVDALRPPFGVAAAGLDGYHYPNAWLDSHPAPPDLPWPGPLRLYKGAEFTFDARRLAADLRRLRSSLEPISLPAYDRSIHDPVEGAIIVRPEDRLVLVEGNYLLCRQGDWAGVRDLFDLRLFLDLPPGVNRERMIARHIRGGRSRQDAEAHFERTDRRNTDLVASTRPEADLVVALDAAYRVVGIGAGPPRPAP